MKTRLVAAIAVVGLCVTAATLLVGVALAVVGAFAPAVVLPIVVAGGLGLLWLADMGAGGLARGVGDRRWWWAAIALAVVATVVNALLGGEHVLVDRDPGVYNMTARWLMDHHDLVVPQLTGPVSGGRTAALYPQPDGTLQFQFVHGLPVLQAAAGWLLGDGARFRAPTALAGLALLTTFALAAQAVRLPYAFLASLALAVSVPFAYTARDTYTEPTMLALVAGGAWALASALRVRSSRRAAFAGVLLGCTACVRVDFVVYLCALAYPLLCLGRLVADPADARRLVPAHHLLPVLAGVLPGVAVGLLDAYGRSRGYAEAQQPDLILLATLTFASVAGGLLLTRVPAVVRRLRPRFTRHGRALATALGAGLSLAAAFAVVVLPHVHVGHDADLMLPLTHPFLEYQQAAGVGALDPTRTFYEHAGRWIPWSTGPFVIVLATVGACLVLRRLATDVARPAELLIAGLTVIPLALIVARPSIYPDQPWASRRLVPFALPGVLMLAALTSQWARDALRRRAPRASRLAAGALGAAILVPTGYYLGRVYDFRPAEGNQALVETICASAADRDGILVLSPGLDVILPGPLRASCHVPAAGGERVTADEVRTRAAAFRAAGAGDLLGVSSTPERLVEAGFVPIAHRRVTMRATLVDTLLSMPTERRRQVLEVFVGRVSAG